MCSETIFFRVMDTLELTPRLSMALVRSTDLLAAHLTMLSEHPTHRSIVWHLKTPRSSTPDSVFEPLNDQIERFVLPNDPTIPPPVKLISDFCSSVAFWLQLDRLNNTAAILVDDPSLPVQLLLITLLIAQGLATEPGEAWSMLNPMISMDPLTSWSPPFKRFLGYASTACNSAVSIKNLTLKSIFVENFPADSLNIQVLHAPDGDWLDSPDQGETVETGTDNFFVFDFTAVSAPSGDLLVTLSSRSSFESPLRFAVNSNFGADIVTLTRLDMETIAPECRVHVIWASPRSPRPSPPPLALWRGSAQAFLCHFVGQPIGLKELVEVGFSYESAAVASRVCKGFLHSVSFLQSTDPSACAAADSFLFWAPLETRSEIGNEDATTEEKAPSVQSELVLGEKRDTTEINRVLRDVSPVVGPKTVSLLADLPSGEQKVLPTTKGKAAPPPLPKPGRPEGRIEPPVPAIRTITVGGPAKAGKAAPPPLPNKPDSRPPPSSRPPAVAPTPAGFLPLGRKFHWRPLPDRNLVNTLWEGFEDVEHLTFAELPDVFGAHSSVEKEQPTGSPGTTAARLTLLDPKRAQNLGVVLARLPDIDQVVRALTELDSAALTPDALERVAALVPTEEELHAFLNCPQDAVLRDVEKKLRPIYLVPRLSQRVRVLCIQRSFESSAGSTQGELLILKRASEELKESGKLRRLLRFVLQLGNYLNFGKVDVGAKGFSLDTLQRLAEFRSSSDPTISTLHFLAAKVVDQQPELVDLLRTELCSLPLACKISTEAVMASVTGLKADAAMLTSELPEYEGEIKIRLQALAARVSARAQQVSEEAAITDSRLVDVRRFFGEDPKRCSSEEFFTAIRSFVDSFGSVCVDLIKHPRKLHKIIQKTT